MDTSNHRKLETMTMTATYSPEDNKLRLYASSRLDPELYARVRAAGFIWAPKQDLFVAPMWTPERESLLLELCDEIGDEDKSLVERSEERADRFSDYSDNRAEDAQRAQEGVAAIADNIPLGQPILVGHHSERHARKDAEKIQNGMRKTVQMWEQSAYWKARAAGAIRHAKYKERPDVRARRIKKLEAEQRKQERIVKYSTDALKVWRSIDRADSLRRGLSNAPTTITERAKLFANADHISMCFPLADYPRDPPTSQYEGAMSLWSALDDGIITGEQAQALAIPAHERTIAHHSKWLEHYTNRLTYERAMLAESGGTVADKTGPEKGGACRCWLSRRGSTWLYIQKVNKVSVTLLDNWGNAGRNFTRVVKFDELTSLMTAAEVQAARDSGNLLEAENKTGFILRDAFGVAPKPAAPEPTPDAPSHQELDAMREQIKTGVQVVVVPQLFPTPAPLASRMVQLAGIEDVHEVLEPSAGTGAILDAMDKRSKKVCAVEINSNLAQHIADNYPWTTNVEGDFLNFNGSLGKFDRIVMNPPFAKGADIAHIQHAMTMLKPGGRLVALCANGPRQNDKLRPIIEAAGGTWEALPAGSFEESGTGVSVALLTFDREAA